MAYPSLTVLRSLGIALCKNARAHQAKMFGQVAPALQVPIWIVQMAIPIVGSLMALRFLQRLISVWQIGVTDATLEELG